MSLSVLNPDFQDLIDSLTRHGVEFIVVGAYALAFHGVPRYTEDLDLWINRSSLNAERLHAALNEFGLPVDLETAMDLAQDADRFFTFGTPPSAVDILNFLSGCDFLTAHSRAVDVSVGGAEVKILSLTDYVATKRASGRLKDAHDLASIQEFLGQELP